MKRIVKKWSDGQDVIIEYNGEGNGVVNVTSSPNHGLDRVVVIQISDDLGTERRFKTITQTGSNNN